MRLGRRELFLLSAFGGLAGAATDIGWRRRKTAPADAGSGDAISAKLGPPCGTESGGMPGEYGGPTTPPLYLGAGALDSVHTPPPYQRRRKGEVRELTIRVIEQTKEIGDGANVEIWGYDGIAPGPIIRASEGEKLRITLVNNTRRRHSLHFHGTHDVNQDGWQSVPPGSSETYEIEAGPFGLVPYHCHTFPYGCHIVHGMYGVMIVDPPGGRPPAHEFVLTLSGWDTNDDGRNEIYTWNGIAGFYARFPLKVPVGELVRLYVTNFVEYDPVGSFHLHAQTFDVYKSGTSLTPSETTDVVLLGQAERAIIEFILPRRGRYMFHPHQTVMAQNGAMGWIAAV